MSSHPGKCLNIERRYKNHYSVLVYDVMTILLGGWKQIMTTVPQGWKADEFQKHFICWLFDDITKT